MWHEKKPLPPEALTQGLWFSFILLSSVRVNVVLLPCRTPFPFSGKTLCSHLQVRQCSDPVCLLSALAPGSTTKGCGIVQRRCSRSTGQPQIPSAGGAGRAGWGEGLQRLEPPEPGVCSTSLHPGLVRAGPRCRWSAPMPDPLPASVSSWKWLSCTVS